LETNNNLLLSVKDLKTYFYTDDGVVRSVDGVDFTIRKGDTLGMVGESGCGKSVTALSILRLIQQPPGKIVSGEIWFKGENLLKKTPEQMRKIRGNDISMIFQEPMTSLNPVYTVGDQISEAIVLHQKLNKEKALKKTVEMLKLVSIPSPESRIHEYPHELSGGQRQRVMIAMALSCNPDLLIADEPTTALDVTIQAQILELIKKLKDEIGMSVLMITHDLGVIAEVSHDVKTIFKNPKHPYTIALQNSIPRVTDKVGKKLEVIQGGIPDPLDLPTGCKFHPRCKFAIDLCKKKEPKLEKIEGNHIVRCWKYNKEKAHLFNAGKKQQV